MLTRIVNILGSKSHNISISIQRIRPWKLSFNGDLSKIQEDIVEARDNPTIAESEVAETDDGKKIEVNTGVKFPGTSLEMMRKF
jgi:hypothetical protein